MIAHLPAGFAGLLLEEAAESRFRNPLVMGTMLIVVGVLMWGGEHVKSHRKNLDDVSFTDAILIGVAQAVAIIPGTSRSGITMVTGLFRGMTRETSARFSFLLSTPIIAGAALKEGVDVLQAGLPDDMLLPFVVGTAVSGLVGYVVIAGLLHFLTRRTFKIFIVYRILLGVVVLLLGWGWRHHLG